MSMGPSIFYKICEAPLTSGFEHRTDVRDHRHFGERDEKTAVGDVVHRRDEAVADQRAHEFAMAALRRKIDRRRSALLAAANLAQIERLAEPAARVADQEDRLALRL